MAKLELDEQCTESHDYFDDDREESGLLEE